MNETENKEGASLQHAAEANREREKEQAVDAGPSGEGNGSVFGNEPRIVSHSTGLPLEEAAAATQDDPSLVRPPQEYGKHTGDEHSHVNETSNPGSDLVNNTGADPSGSGADAASG